MKNLHIFLAYLVAILPLAGCKNYFNPHYAVDLPSAPEAWVSAFGEPHWRMQWLNPEGNIQKIDVPPGKKAEITIPVTWTNPVTAWPWWPKSPHNLAPGVFKPAGGFFPFDAGNGRITLSWEKGPDTVFYWEMAYANSDNETRLPSNFDWLRFRELFTTGVLSEAVCEDPWLIDWKSVAEDTIASGFDRRRLKADNVTLMAIPAGAGADPWRGTSPFAEPLMFLENETPVFPIRLGINVWFSDKTILRASENAWILTEIKR